MALSEGGTETLDRGFVSVIIASKDPLGASLALCLASFSALKIAHRIQIVLVESGEPAIIDPTVGALFASFVRLHVPPEGVYAAYNAGVGSADGTYLLFFGVDDIALPGMDKIISHLMTVDEPYQLFAAACYMEATGLRVPSTNRNSLIFGNWCHQGIFYLRHHLSDQPYDLRYCVQADHKLNIDIVSDRALRFGVACDLVSYFSAGGISSTFPDLAFRRDFPSIVASGYGPFWGCIAWLKQRIVDVIAGDPDARFRRKHANR